MMHGAYNVKYKLTNSVLYSLLSYPVACQKRLSAETDEVPIAHSIYH